MKLTKEQKDLFRKLVKSIQEDAFDRGHIYGKQVANEIYLRDGIIKLDKTVKLSQTKPEAEQDKLSEVKGEN